MSTAAPPQDARAPAPAAVSDVPVRRFAPVAGEPAPFRWEGVELTAYKHDPGVPFRDVTRQTLFRRDDLAGELRYFEVAAGGHSTLERHHHVHAVLVLRGQGRCLVGDTVFTLDEHDLVTIPALTWHQFRAAPDAPLGFLCMVDAKRDKPQLPDADALATLRATPDVAAFLEGGPR